MAMGELSCGSWHPAGSGSGGILTAGTSVGASPASPSAEFPFQTPRSAHPPRIPRSSPAAPPLSPVLKRGRAAPAAKKKNIPGAVGETEESGKREASYKHPDQP